MDIGPYTLRAIETGEFALDGGAMFGVVPKTLWQKRMGADEKNRIDLRLRCLLIQGKGKNILVDDGIGEKGDEKFQSIYRIDHTRFSLTKALASYNLTCDDITDVILTHLHFDHAGGSTCRLADGRLVPTFPNATYYVQRQNYEWAQHATDKDRASYLHDNFAPIVEAKKFVFLNGPQELFPGIHLMIFDGHTKQQQLPCISDGKHTLFFCADLFPTSLHLKPPWVMAYDNWPLITIEEKHRLLDMAFQKNWVLFFEHCPFLAACTLAKNEKEYAIGQTIDL